MEKTKTTPLNAAQKELLVEFLLKHNELNSGRFTVNFTKKTAQNLWQKLADSLNSIPNGAKKSWEQWRKAWQDQKKNTKSKLQKSKVHAAGTGGGPPLEDMKLNDYEKNVVSLINPVTISGDSNIEESMVILDAESEKEENTSNLMLDAQNEATVNASTSREEETSHSVGEISAQSSTFQTQKFKMRVPNRIKRFNRTLETSQNLLKSCENRNQYQTEYYKEKLILLKSESKRRAQYEEKKLKLLEKRNLIENNILQELQVLTNSLGTK